MSIDEKKGHPKTMAETLKPHEYDELKADVLEWRAAVVEAGLAGVGSPGTVAAKIDSVLLERFGRDRKKRSPSQVVAALARESGFRR